MNEAVDRVRAALAAAGYVQAVVSFPTGTRTAQDAAAAVGCDVAQIAKSIVFRSGDQAVVVITSGANRVDKARAGAAAGGLKLAPAGPDFVLAATGFVPGGVSPLGLKGAPVLLIDRDLFAYTPIWAAAGSPMHVFRTTAGELQAMTGATVADVKQS